MNRIPGASLVAQSVKNLSVVQETQVRSLGQEDPLEKEMANHPGMGFPDTSVGKESAWNAGDPGLIPGSGRSAREGIGYPLQYSWVSYFMSTENVQVGLSLSLHMCVFVCIFHG